MTQFYIPRRRLLTSAAAGGFVGLIKPARAGLVPCGGTLIGVQPESIEGASVTTVGPKLWDAAGNSYAISSGGQILFNGALDHDPGSGVVQLYYHNHQVYQFNGTTWYTRSTPTANWASTTSPIGSGGGSNTSGITPKYFDDFSSGSLDWTNTWYGYPPGSPGYIDQSTIQADCQSTRIIRSGSKNYLINSVFRKPADAPSSISSIPFCTAEIVSRATYTYGYLIGRMKAPIDNNVMAAFWAFHALPSQQIPDIYQELDLMENPYTSNGTRPISMTVHTSDAGYANGANVYYNYWQPAQDGTHWHTYAVEWDAPNGNITFYLDGQQKYQKYTPSGFTAAMRIWVSTYNGQAWYNTAYNADGSVQSTLYNPNSTNYPQNSVYDWIGWFNNKSEADTFFAANTQYSTASGGTDGPSTTGQL